MRIVGLGLAALMMSAGIVTGCFGEPASAPTPSPTQPPPQPVECESDSVTFASMDDSHDAYKAVCVEEGLYFLNLMLDNRTDEWFRLYLHHLSSADPQTLYQVQRKTIPSSPVAEFKVCRSDCDVTPGWVRIEVDAPHALGSVDWEILVEKVSDST